MNRITYRSEIINALKSLNGMASLKEIKRTIRERDLLPSIHTNKNWEENVSTELQEHCSQTKSYRGAEDIFYAVYGVGEGFWGLNEMRSSNEMTSKDTNPIIRRIEEDIIQDAHIDNTEREMIVQSRIGQGSFRESLLRKYNGKCIITGINNPKLLLASHIKPWRAANNKERLNAENGLLLSPLYDKLFDSGLITFDTNMKIIISDKLDDYNRNIININCDHSFIKKPSFELQRHMEYHRDKIFVH